MADAITGVVTNLATEALLRLSERGFQKRLAAHVVDRVALPISKKRLAKWLESESTWELLAPGDYSEVPKIAKGLRGLMNLNSRKAKRLSRDEIDRMCTDAAHATLSAVLTFLSASEAAAVADFRNDLRIQGVRDDIAALDTMQFEAILAGLPSVCRPWIQQLRSTHPAGASRLGETLSERTHDPESLKRDVDTVPSPIWLRDLSWQGWEAVAAFLGAYGLDGTAAEEAAVDAGSPNRGYHLARQAIHLHNEGASGQASSILSQTPDPEDVLARAVAAYIAEDASDAERIAGESPSGHLSQEARLLLARIRIWALANLDRIDDAIAAAEQLARSAPDRSSPFTTLAELLFQEARGEPSGSDRQLSLYERSLEAALAARMLTRSWGGDALEMSRLAVRLKIVLGDLKGAAELAMPPPHGSATVREIADPEIRGNAAIALAISEDNLDLGADKPLPAYYQHFRDAVLTDDSLESTNHLRSALSTASEPDQQIMVQLHLARRGYIDRDALGEARKVSSETADLIEATYAASCDELGKAEAFLRPHLPSEPHVDLLSQVLLKQGKVDEAVRVLVDAAERLGNDTLAALAIDALVRAERMTEAEIAAQRLLVANIRRGDGARHLRRYLVSRAHQRGDLPDLVVHAKALLQDFPDDRDAAWAVVYANYKGARFRHAWEELQNLQLKPYDERTAIIAIDLIGRYRPAPSAPDEILAVATDFPEDELVHAAAIGTIHTRFASTPLPAPTVARLQDTTSDFIRRYPDSPAFTAIDTTDLDVAVEEIKAMLAPAARVRARLAAQVRVGRLPFGMFAQSVHGGHETTAYATGYQGLLQVIADKELSREADRCGAEAALGNAVVVDVSVPLLDVLFVEQQLWDLAAGQLAQMRNYGRCPCRCREGCRLLERGPRLLPGLRPLR